MSVQYAAQPMFARSDTSTQTSRVLNILTQRAHEMRYPITLSEAGP